MNIGNRVTSKKTGLPMTGTVCGLLDAKIYLSINPGYYLAWLDLYPNWAEDGKRVLYVKFDSPQKGCSFEEYSSKPQNLLIPIDELKILYKYEIPKVQVAIYPEDDLELIHEFITTD